MIILAESPEEYAEKGLTPEKQSSGHKKIQGDHGMPIDWRQRPRMAGTIDACRAVVAARLNAPDHEAALLRRLRVLCMGGGLLDDPVVPTRAVSEAGLDTRELERWAATPEVEAELQADRTATRTPSAAARASIASSAGPPLRSPPWRWR